jgi:hypothetical protein
MNHRKVYEWIETFKSGRTSVTDGPGSGRHHTEHAKALLFEKTDGFSVSELAEFLDVRRTEACSCSR